MLSRRKDIAYSVTTNLQFSTTVTASIFTVINRAIMDSTSRWPSISSGTPLFWTCTITMVKLSLGWRAWWVYSQIRCLISSTPNISTRWSSPRSPTMTGRHICLSASWWDMIAAYTEIWLRKWAKTMPWTKINISEIFQKFKNYWPTDVTTLVPLPDLHWMD